MDLPFIQGLQWYLTPVVTNKQGRVKDFHLFYILVNHIIIITIIGEWNF